MGLQMVAYLAKLKLLSNSSHITLSPMVAGLVWPFMLKLCFSFKLVRQTYSDLLHSSRLFLFQLGRIAFDPTELPDHNFNIGNNNGNRSRLERALRLVQERVAHVRRSQGLPSSDHDDHHQDSLHTLSMLALWSQTSCTPMAMAISIFIIKIPFDFLLNADHIYIYMISITKKLSNFLWFMEKIWRWFTYRCKQCLAS